MITLRRCAMIVLLGSVTVESRAQNAPVDTASLPAGYGTLRQDDIAIKVQVNGLQVRVLPLDETVIRTLSPDSYRTLRELRDSKQKTLNAVLRRTGMPGASLWYVQFFNLEQGEARFSPMELLINSAGRDFRAVDVFALTTGFGEQRLRQREVQAALYVFDPAVDINQPLTVMFETQSSATWEATLKRVDQERAMVRSRGAKKP